MRVTRRGVLAAIASLFSVIPVAAEGDYQPDRSHNSDRHSDLAVLDANTYKNKRRLERILDALDNIPDQADRARERYNQGDIDLHARRIAVQDAVNDAIWEARNLLRDHDRKCRREAAEALFDYLADQNEEFDRLAHEPTDIQTETLREAYQVTGVWPYSPYSVSKPGDEPLGVIPQVNEDHRIVNGLLDFWKLDETWREQWVENYKPDNLPLRKEPREVHHTVPLKVSWAAAVRLKEFLNDEHDLEIQFKDMGDSLPSWGFEELDDVPDGVEVI